MNCAYCTERIAPATRDSGAQGLLVMWRDGVPRPVLPYAKQVFCNERHLYKYLAVQLRIAKLPAQPSSERILRILTESGDFLVKGDG